MPNGKILLSVSESLCLFRNLPFVTGNMVPESDEAWSLYILLSKIVDIVLAPSICAEETAKLKTHVEQFYSIFVTLAPDLVKPRLHFLLHYPRLIAVYGSLRYLWCMRLESFYRKVKLLAHNCQNFKNESIMSPSTYFQRYVYPIWR